MSTIYTPLGVETAYWNILYMHVDAMFCSIAITMIIDYYISLLLLLLSSLLLPSGND